MSAKDQIKRIVDAFKREPQLKDKTDGMAEGLLLGAQLADDANELSKETDANFKALQREYTENGNGAQTTAEITVARDGELVLDDRLKRDFGNVNAQLAQMQSDKASINYVDALLMDIAKGGPQGPFNSVSALKAAYPNGVEGTWLVFDPAFTDGAHSFMWDSANSNWKDLGLYQAVGIGEKSVDFTKLGDDVVGLLGAETNKPVTVDFNSTNTSTNITGTSNPPTTARLFVALNIPLTNEGVIYINVKAKKQVTERAVLLRKTSDTKYEVVAWKQIKLNAGINTVNTNLEIIQSGEYYIGITDSLANYDGTIGNLYYNSTSVKHGMLMVFDFNYATHTSITVSPSTAVVWDNNQFALEVTLVTSIKNQVDDLSKQINSIPDRKIENRSIYTEKFLNNPLPELGSWVTEGSAWRYENGAIPVPSSTFDNYSYWKQPTNFDADTIKYRVLLNDVTSKFRLARISTLTSNTKTTTAEYDNGIIKLYEAANGFTKPSTVVVEKQLSFSLTQGREYLFVLDSYGFTVKFKVVDLVTGESDSIEWDNGIGKPSVGLCHDYPMFALGSGSVVIKQFDYFTRLNRSPKVLIIGDSIVEGFTIKNVAGGGDNTRWVKKLYNDLNGDCAIMGVGGETSASFLPKIPVLEKSFYRPEYVLLELMTNDSDFTSWKTTFDKLVTWCDSVGAVPVICMMPMRAGRENLYDAILYYVQNSKHKVLWFNRLLTVNGDGKTRKSDYDLDGLHPNVLGHEAMYNYTKDTLEDFIPVNY